MAHSFYELAALSERLSRTRSRRERAERLGNYLKNLQPSVIPQAVNLIVGRVFPEWDPRRLDVSWAAVFKVVRELAPVREMVLGDAIDAGAGVSDEDYREAGPSDPGVSDEDFGKIGIGPSDPGVSDEDFGKIGIGPSDPVEQIMESLPARKLVLELEEVYRYFEEISRSKGTGSRKKKEALLKELLGRATPLEAKFIAKAVIGEMRHGVSDGIVQDGIARVSGIGLAAVQRAFMLSGDLGEVAKIAFETGGVTSIRLELFRPLKPMLAQTAETIAAAFDELDADLALEHKYDGVRVQIHKAGDTVKIFSRRLTDITRALPEVAAAMKTLPAAKMILEGEVIGVDRNDRPLPFQHIMRRLTRVKDVLKMAAVVPVRVFLFDCLFWDGELLIDLPYRERWQRLETIRGSISLAARRIPENPEEGEKFLAGAIAEGHEGVMAKSLASPYTPGIRGKAWLKIKPAITLDLVIIAADWGYGRRHHWLSNYHLAAWNEERKEFAMVGKTFKGLTDEEFSRITKSLLNLKISEKRGTVFVQPQQVVEVAFNEIQASTRYSSGMALRFARIRAIRDDKSPKEIATTRELKQLYERQFMAKGKLL